MKHKHAEIWRDIEGYIGHYEVSNFGRVRSIKFDKIKILKQANTNYPSVSLWKNGLLKVMKVHRLVAKAFIDNPDNKPEVNHKDANRLNNSAGNLEWCTRAENTRHAAVNKLMPRNENHPNCKLSNSDVLTIRRMRGIKTQKELAKMFDCSKSNINYIQNNYSRKLS